MDNSRALAGLILTVLVLPTAAGSAASPELPDPPRLRHHTEEAAAHRAAYERAIAAGYIADDSWAPQLAPSPIDVLHYDLDLHLDLDRQVLSGVVEVELAAAEEGLEQVELDADQGLRVVSVILRQDVALPHDGPRQLSFEHRADHLTVQLHRCLSADEQVRLLISYGGRGGRSRDGVRWETHGDGTPVIHTLSEPFGARLWWPCNDRPDDKATVDVTVTAPDWLTVASNGLLLGRTSNLDGTATTSWSSRYPVASYLVVMNASDFTSSEQRYDLGNGETMPVVLYAYPEIDELARSELAQTPAMLAYLSETFGQYPFAEEKYGNCITPFGGGMEHQTLTSMGEVVIRGERAQWFNVHELAHQWWGDWITLGTWRDLWLNEGFAVLAELLWADHLGDEVAFQYLAELDWAGFYLGPVYDNPVPFSRTVYRKGAWVIYMLLELLGEETTNRWGDGYLATFGGGSATTAELQAIIEEAADTDLDWFFQQWVYGSNRPRYQYSWTTDPGGAVQLHVSQVQTNAPLFRMPMDVLVLTTDGAEEHQVWVEALRQQVIDIPLSSEPTDVVLDPHYRVLCELSTASDPDLDLGPEFPGPFSAGLVQVGSSAVITIPLSNLGGSELALSDISADSSGRFAMLSPGELPLTVPSGESADLQVSFTPAGEGTRSHTFEIVSNDVSRIGNPTTYLIVEGTGILAPGPVLQAPSQIDFGEVPVGGTADALVEIGNAGGADLILALDTTTGGDDVFSLAGVLPASLAPGQQVQLAMRFAPVGAGELLGTLAVLSNDEELPRHEISLSGTGTAAPRINVTPGLLTFGLVEQVSDATVAIHSAGTAELVISDVAVDLPFSLADPLDLPLVIAPGDSAELAVRITGEAAGTLDGTLRILSNDPVLPWTVVPLAGYLAVAQTERLQIPAVALAPGIGDVRWTTDAVLLNPTAGQLAVDLRFLPAGGLDAQTPAYPVSVPAGGQRVLPNVVATLGKEGSGGLELLASATGLVAVSRTFATPAEDAGSFGQHIAAVSQQQALAGGRNYVLAALAGNDGFHTNLGLLNLGSERITVSFHLSAADGSELGNREMTAAAGGYAFASSVLSQLDSGPIRGGFAVLSCPESDARFLAFASVVDDTSHDPTFLSPREPGSSGSCDEVIPVLASNTGLSGTCWRSALSLVNSGETTAAVTLDLHTADGATVSSQLVDVPAGQALHLPRVVGETFGYEGTGWLQISSAASALVATARIFNDDLSGTYGQAVPALPAGELLTTGERAVLPGLRSADGFRCNLGLTSLSEVATTIQVRVFTGSGTLVGELPVSVPAGGFVQISRLLRRHLGYDGWAWAMLSCDHPKAQYAAHASVVDGHTGDPAYISAVKIASP